MSFNVANYCKSNGIIPWFLVPNASHLMQPLDCSYFGALKKNVNRRRICFNSSIGLTNNNKLDKYSLLNLVRLGMEDTPKTAVSAGFSMAGIYLWNPEKANEMFQMMRGSESNNSVESPVEQAGTGVAEGDDAVEREQESQQQKFQQESRVRNQDQQSRQESARNKHEQTEKEIQNTKASNFYLKQREMQ